MRAMLRWLDPALSWLGPARTSSDAQPSWLTTRWTGRLPEGWRGNTRPHVVSLLEVLATRGSPTSGATVFADEAAIWMSTA